MSKTQLVVMLFETQGKLPPKGHEHEYTFIGDEHGGTYVRGVTRRYPVENERKGVPSPYSAAMDEAFGILPKRQPVARKGEGFANSVPARPRPRPRYAPAIVIVHGGVGEVIEGQGADVRVIDQDNIAAGDPPMSLPRGEGFEALLARCSGLVEGHDYVWEETTCA